MFGRHLPTKTTFLEQNVVLANDNDAFNDGKCCFCWDTYSDSHPGVRLLPCNHVIGRDCLLEVIEGPNGDTCPICRTQLYRPSVFVTVQRFYWEEMAHLEMAVLQMLMPLIAKATEIVESMPPWLQLCIRFAQHLCRFWMGMDNVYYYAELLVNCTGLRERNPGLDMTYLKTFCRIGLSVSGLCRRALSACRNCQRPYAVDHIICKMSNSNAEFHILVTIGIVLYLSYSGRHGQLYDRRDQFIFCGIMVMAVVVQAMVFTVWLRPKARLVESMEDVTKSLEETRLL